jgi:arginine/lysine/ornithine decarboxylase
MGQILGYAFQCEEMLHFEHQEQKPENVHPGRTHITTSPKQPILRATDIGKPKMDNSHHQRSQESKLNTQLS